MLQIYLIIIICIFLKLVQSTMSDQYVKLCKSLKHTGSKAFLESAGRGLGPLCCSSDVEKLGFFLVDADCPTQGENHISSEVGLSVHQLPH